jgi:hypothetical protein
VALAPWNKGFAYLPLSNITVDATVRSWTTPERKSRSGWEIRLGAQVQIPRDPEALRTAAANLLDRSEDEIRAIVRHALEGAVPAILARDPPETFEHDLDRLAAEIQVSTGADLVNFGLTIRTLTIQGLRPIVGSELNSAETSPGLVRWPDAYPAPAEVVARLHQTELRLEQIERTLGVVDAQIVHLARALPAPVQSEPSAETYAYANEDPASADTSSDSTNRRRSRSAIALQDSLDRPSPTIDLERSGATLTGEGFGEMRPRATRKG